MRNLSTLAVPVVATVTLSAQTRFAELGATDHLPPENRIVLDAASADLNGDGAPDLLLMQRDGVVALHNRRHDGVFDEAFRLAFGASPVPRSGALGVLDVDSDGDTDVLVSITGGDSWLLRNDGSGAFVAEASPVSGMVRDFAIGDVDGDGDDDVLAGCGRQPGVPGSGVQSRLYRNDGGTLVDVTATRLPVEAKNTSAVALFDADGDGDLDAFCGNAAHYLGPSPQNELWINDGAGAFTLAAGALPVDADGDEGLAVGDLDGDGDLDVVTARADVRSPSGMRIYFNDGSGSFVHGDGAMPASSGTSATGVALLDRDADGDLDIVLGDAGVSSYVNNGGVFGAGPLLSSRDSVARIVAFDADGAAGADLLLANRGPTGTGQRARLLLDDGSGGLLDACATRDFGEPMGGFSGAEMALADFGNDGDVDMVHTGLDPQPLRLRHSAGDAPLIDVTATHVPPITGGWIRQLGVLDLDGDGRDDVWARHQAGDAMTMLVGAGDGSLALLPAAQTPAIGAGLFDVESADLDRNGTQDLFVGDVFGLHVWLASAPLDWALDTRTAFAPGLVEFELGDVDDDGDLDVAAKSGSWLASSTVQIWRNDGTGAFAFAQTLTMPKSTKFSGMQFADADGDGDLDLFALADAAAWFANDGSGGFGAAIPLPMTGSNRHDRLLDADLDGDPDLCRHGFTSSPTLELWVNDGTGTFTDATATAFAGATHGDIRSFEIADLDGDGDPDLAFDEFGVGVRVLWNQHRHASVPWLARRGRLHRFAWIGRPGEILLPLMAGAAATTPLPPFGDLRLDVHSLGVLPGVVTPPGGSHTLEFFVPDHPALNGIELHIQALHFGPPAQAGTHAWSTPIE